MNFSNVDPQLSQFMAQILQFKQQIILQAGMVKGVNITNFIVATDELINSVGAEIQKQALDDNVVNL